MGIDNDILKAIDLLYNRNVDLTVNVLNSVLNSILKQSNKTVLPINMGISE